MIGLAAILFLIVLIPNILRDQSYYLTNRATNHNNRFWIRFFCLLPCVTVLSLRLVGIIIWQRSTWNTQVSEFYKLLCLNICFALVASLWASIFDTTLNILRGEKPLFPGGDGPEDGFLENLYQAYWWTKWIKILFAIIFITLYIWLL